MSIDIISVPDRVVSTDGLSISKWNSVHHPIKFGLQRKDFTAIMFMLTSDTLKSYLTVTASTVFTVGDTFYFETANSSGQATVTYLSGTELRATVTSYSGTLPTTYNPAHFNTNTRLNYYAKVKVWGVNDASEYYEIGTSIVKPDSTGRVSVDVSSFLKSIVSYRNTFEYDQVNKIDSGLGGRYNITVSENWTGYEGTFTGLSETVLRYFVNSAKQIQDKFGSNMGEYVPFLTYNDGDPKAKFLTEFEKPTYFQGFPFDLAFIYSENIYGFEVKKFEEKRDVNGNSLASAAGTMLSFYEGLAVNRLMLTGSYASNVNTVDVWLDNSEGGTIPPPPVERLMGESGYVEDGYFVVETGLPTVSTANIEAS